MKKSGKYWKFALMMVVSFIMMYAVMFFNVFQIDHVLLSTMRTYMTILMIAPMAVSMLLFMWDMYDNKKLNYAIIIGSIGVFVVTFFAMRKQVPINDVQWMKAMIPHHSSAILTSTYADLKDPEVKKLAEEIIMAQEKEIAEMKAMIKRLEEQSDNITSN